MLFHNLPCTFFLKLVTECLWLSYLSALQACRGHELDGGVEVETDSSFSEEEDVMSELFSIPIDTAVMYATSPGVIY